MASATTISKSLVRVGVGVFVVNASGTKFLVGKRKGSHGSGKLQLPGGHLEYGESFEECAEREVLEETGLKVSGAIFQTATNDIMSTENKHYVTIFMKVQVAQDQPEPRVMEPHKCEYWKWISKQEFDNLPEEDLFMPLQNLRKCRLHNLIL